MKILLTGSTGYIGKRLLSVLVKNGHEVICCVRDVNRFSPPESLKPNISVIEIDLLDENSLKKIPADIDGAYYLVHSMSVSDDYKKLEEQSAVNFREALNRTNVNHVIYLGGIVNESNLSEHLASRKNVEEILNKGNYHFTSFRAGVIIGSGSASFEIIRDLVEKLPVMIAPRWLKTKCQPISISDVITVLSKSLFHKETFDKVFDIGGADILTYKDMLLGYAKARNLKRRIWTVPVMTPGLSSYWLYFVTSTSYKLARALVDSMSIEVVCRDSSINNILSISPVGYQEAIKNAFKKTESNEIESSWKDSNVSSNLNIKISDFINVPQYGCFVDKRIKKFYDREKCINKIWTIGGKNGWYYGNWLWELRGFLDKIVGGVGLRRGRTNQELINAGDSLDFWRVLYANRQEGRLLLFAEMKLPGEAWLEFKITGDSLTQTATFRPLGLAGRLYWYSAYPFHGFIFRGLINRLTE
ncbi:MAG: SDR family oxidoreductase [Ignavibacteria bacterium]|nr:SDR family oxidoreductase [Ignavibacteria bacterium]